MKAQVGFYWYFSLIPVWAKIYWKSLYLGVGGMRYYQPFSGLVGSHQRRKFDSGVLSYILARQEKSVPDNVRNELPGHLSKLGVSAS